MSAEHGHRPKKQNSTEMIHAPQNGGQLYSDGCGPSETWRSVKMTWGLEWERLHFTGTENFSCFVGSQAVPVRLKAGKAIEKV
jgi:hypothetical protein